MALKKQEKKEVFEENSHGKILKKGEEATKKKEELSSEDDVIPLPKHGHRKDWFDAADTVIQMVLKKEDHYK